MWRLRSVDEIYIIIFVKVRKFGKFWLLFTKKILSKTHDTYIFYKNEARKLRFGLEVPLL